MISKTNKPLIFTTDLYWPGHGSCVTNSHPADQSVTIKTYPDSSNTEKEWCAEQLFLSAITSSLLNTYLELSKKIMLINTGFECTATGQAELSDGKMVFTFIHVYPKAYVNKEADIETALVTLEKAKKICTLYNSITAEIIQHSEAVLAKKKNKAA